MITMIAAMDQNNVIGKDGRIPWKISADLRRFKKLTTGHTVIMGRKTFESLPAAFRPLPNRKNIVLTSQSNYGDGGIEICQTMVAVIDIFNDYKAVIDRHFNDDETHPEIFIIGGAFLYSLCIPFADKLELTFVDGKYEGDTFFPGFFRIGDEITFDEHNIFTRTEFEYPIRQQDEPIYSFQTFERIKK